MKSVAPHLTTQRLELRTLRAEDADALATELFADRRVTAYLPSQPVTPAGQHALAEEYIVALTDPWETSGHGGWAVSLRTPERCGELIGYCGFFVNELSEAGPAFSRWAGPELGFGFARRCWGRGYATEAVIASLRGLFAVGRVERVFATCVAANRASRRVLEKAAMRYRGDYDIFGSVADGWGEMPLFTAERQQWSAPEAPNR